MAKISKRQIETDEAIEKAEQERQEQEAKDRPNWMEAPASGEASKMVSSSAMPVSTASFRTPSQPRRMMETAVKAFKGLTETGREAVKAASELEQAIQAVRENLTDEEREKKQLEALRDIPRRLGKEAAQSMDEQVMMILQEDAARLLAESLGSEAMVDPDLVEVVRTRSLKEVRDQAVKRGEILKPEEAVELARSVMPSIADEEAEEKTKEEVLKRAKEEGYAVALPSTDWMQEQLQEGSEETFSREQVEAVMKTPKGRQLALWMQRQAMRETGVPVETKALPRYGFSDDLLCFRKQDIISKTVEEVASDWYKLHVNAYPNREGFYDRTLPVANVRGLNVLVTREQREDLMISELVYRFIFIISLEDMVNLDLL